MRILGVDPGLEITGYGCINTGNNGIVLVEAGVIRTNRYDNSSTRLTGLYNNFTDILTDFNPEAVVVEELYAHYKHPRTAIIMGHARGVILLAAGMQSINVVSYGANRIKKSLTGSGHAGKEQMQRMVMSLLRLDKLPSPPDIADALAAALCHANVVIRNIPV